MRLSVHKAGLTSYDASAEFQNQDALYDSSVGREGWWVKDHTESDDCDQCIRMFVLSM